MGGWFTSGGCKKMYDSTEDTLRHKKGVLAKMKHLAETLKYRGEVHDNSKLESPEKEIFDQNSNKLESMTYGSEEYQRNIEQMKIALDHHYQHNRHHPQHFENGILGMNLIDICEMLCDWSDSVGRTKNGNIYESIELNQHKFGYSDDLKQILKNTVKNYFEE